MNESQTQNTDQKKTDTKYYALCGSIYMKLKNRQN